MFKRRRQIERATVQPTGSVPKTGSPYDPTDRLWEQFADALLTDERRVCGTLLERSATTDHELNRLKARTRALQMAGSVEGPFDRVLAEIHESGVASETAAGEVLATAIAAAGLATTRAASEFVAARAEHYGADAASFIKAVQRAGQAAKAQLWTAKTISSALSGMLHDGEALPVPHASVACSTRPIGTNVDDATSAVIDTLRGLGRGSGPPRSRHRAGIFERPSVSFDLGAVAPHLRPALSADDRREIADRLDETLQVAREEDILVFLAAPTEERLLATLTLYADVLARPVCQRWDGFGMTLSAASRRAVPELRLLREFARERGAPLPVRLAHSQTWCADVTWAVADAMADYPVLTAPRRVSAQFVACARAILAEVDHFHGVFSPETPAERAAIEVFGQARAYDVMVSTAQYNEISAEHLEPVSDGRLRLDLAIGAPEACLAAWADRASEQQLRAALQVSTETSENAHAAEQNFADPISALAREFEAAAGGGLCGWLRAPTRIDDDRHLAPRAPIGQSGRSESIFPCPPDAPISVDGEVASEGDGSEIGGVGADGKRIRALRATQTQWAAVPLGERVAAVHGWVADLEAQHKDLVAWLVSTRGLTLRDAFTEVWYARERVRAVCRTGEDMCEQAGRARRAGPAHVVQSSRPLGIVGVLPGQASPIADVVGPISSALIGGNAVVVAPAPATSELVEDLVAGLELAGLPSGLVILPSGTDEALDGDAGASPALIFPVATGLDAIYVGGAAERLADVVRRRAQARLPSVPVVGPAHRPVAAVVDATVPLDHAADAISASVLAFAGQGARALRSVVADATIADGLCARIVDRLAQARLGAPERLDTDVGPMADAVARDLAIAEKARVIAETELVYDGFVPVERFADPYVAPMVVKTAPGTMIRFEAAGPFVAITPVPDKPALMAAVSQLAPLSHLALFTADRAWAHQLMGAVPASTVAHDPVVFGPCGAHAHWAATGAYAPGLQPADEEQPAWPDLFTKIERRSGPVV